MNKTLDRPTVRVVHQAINRAVEEIAKAHGFAVTPKGASYDSTMGTISFKVELVLESKVNEVANMYAVEGWSVGDLGRGSNGRTYKVVGFSNRGNLRIERQPDGKRFRCPPHALKKVDAKEASRA